MIEFLPPRRDAFGTSDAADFEGIDDGDAGWDDDEPPRSRWLTAVAVCGVTALLAGGVLAAAPWSADEQAAPPTTDRPTPTTATSVPIGPADPSIGPSIADGPLPDWLDDGVAGYVLQDEDDFTFAYASSYEGIRWEGDVVDLWAEPGAERTTGRWLAVSSLRSSGEYHPLVADATPVAAGDADALVWSDVDGVVNLLVDPGTRSRFRLTAHGIELGDLLTWAATVRLGTGAFEYGELVGADGLLGGMSPAGTSRTAWSGSFVDGQLLASTQYIRPRTNEFVDISFSTSDPVDRRIVDLIGSTRVDPDTLDRASRARLDQLERLGIVPQVRSHLWLSGWNAVRWDSVDGTTVTLQGPVEAPVLLDLAVHAVRAAPRQWEALVRTTANGVGIPAREFDQPTVIAQGPEMWEAVVDGDRLSIYGPSYDATVELAPESGPQLRVLRSLGHAFVIATNTWPETGRQIVVSQPGSPAAAPVRLEQIGDRPVYATVVAIDPDESFTVRWLDAADAPVEGPAS